MPDQQNSPTPNIRPRSIPGYQMPAKSVLALNKINWPLDPQSAVLLIHDVQKYWLAPFEQPELFVNNIRLLRQWANQQGIPVIFSALKVAQTNAERGLAYDLFGPGIGRMPDAQPDDHEIIAALAPAENEHLLLKTKYSAFFQTDLQQMLETWGRKQIMLCGVFAHQGCMITAIDAYMHEYQVFFVADALGSYSAETHQMALEYVAGLCGQLAFTSDILR